MWRGLQCIAWHTFCLDQAIAITIDRHTGQSLLPPACEKYVPFQYRHWNVLYKSQSIQRAEGSFKNEAGKHSKHVLDTGQWFELSAALLEWWGFSTQQALDYKCTKLRVVLSRNNSEFRHDFVSYCRWCSGRTDGDNVIARWGPLWKVDCGKCVTWGWIFGWNNETIRTLN